jgi:hypothetical protein
MSLCEMHANRPRHQSTPLPALLVPAEPPVEFDSNVTHHMQLYDVGMTALYLSDTAALISLANARNRTDVVPMLQERLDRVTTATNQHMWNNDTGLYTNVCVCLRVVFVDL